MPNAPLAAALITLWSAMHAQHAPNTDTNRKPNGLAGQTSPYLLQHQFNPIDWKPWGPEAFAEARERDVPIFLSVGYSTCYWCHVMERESFEDGATAAVMNRLFVCVKVDREERPDVDDIYMAAVQLFNQGHGGWPMSVWLTPPGSGGEGDPGLKPFYAGTYFPREPMHGRPSLTMVSERLGEAWRQQRGEVIEQAERAAGAVREQLSAGLTPVRVDEQTIAAAIGGLLRSFDEANGGFGGAPKFPQPVYTDFLIDSLDSIDSPAFRAQSERTVRKTLDAMAQGGMYDQAGGGFHRYSVDAEWLVPHFEKMLYDQAQLVSLYAKWFALKGDAFDARVVRETLGYVEREMTGAHGMFFSAQDAEVDAREGANYLWTMEEFEAVLGEDAALAARVYGVADGPNFRDPHHPGEPARNVLHLKERPSALAEGLGLTADELAGKIESIDARLYEARMQRKQPGLDDKVIASWNGLMIGGLAEAARALQDPHFLEVGERASDAVWGMLRDDAGTLQRTFRGGSVSGDAVFEDYAMLMRGELALHRACAALGRDGSKHLSRAGELLREARARFGDGAGGFYDTEERRSDLFVRTRATYDGALPSASSVMLHNLIDLFEATGEQEHLDGAVALLTSMSGHIGASPIGLVNATRGVHRLMAIDETIPDRLGRPADEGDAAAGPARVLSRTNRVVVPSDGEATLELRIEIDEGYHLNAHEPGVEGLVGLSVAVEGGAGVEVEAAYPEGSGYDGGFEAGGALMVYEGAFDLAVTLRRSGAWSGRPMLIVTYQACTDSACLPPETVELDIAIDPGD